MALIRLGFHIKEKQKLNELEDIIGVVNESKTLFWNN